MSMEKRSNDTWRFRSSKDGQLYTKTFQGTKGEAKKAHAAFLVDIDRNDVGINENMKFHELAQIVYEDYVKVNLKFRTQELYKNAYNNHLLKPLGKVNINKISTYRIQQLVNDLNKDFKPNTVRGVISILSKTLSIAISWGFIKTNPCQNLNLPRNASSSNDSLATYDEIMKLFAFYDTEKNLLHKSAFYLAIGCGLRNSEIRALTLDDIDFTTGLININKQIGRFRNEEGKIIDGNITPKTDGSVRKILAPTFVLKTIKEHIASLPYIPLSKHIYFNVLTNKPISSHCLSKRFTTIINDNNFPLLRFHDLRHLQATLLIHSGADIQSISKRLGHTSLKTTFEVYTHSLDTADQKTVIALEKYININN